VENKIFCFVFRDSVNGKQRQATATVDKGLDSVNGKQRQATATVDKGLGSWYIADVVGRWALGGKMEETKMNLDDEIKEVRQAESIMDLVGKIDKIDLINWLTRDKIARNRFFRRFNLGNVFAVFWRGDSCDSVDWDCVYVTRCYESADNVRGMINRECCRYNRNDSNKGWVEIPADMDTDQLESFLSFLFGA